MRDPESTIEDEGAWLAERRNSIGGSDAPAVLGVDAYRSPYQVWLDKTGQAPPIEENEAMRFGKLLEPVIADEFEHRTGWKLEDPKAFWRHPEHPHMHYTPDRIIRHPSWGYGLLEIKNRSAYVGSDWEHQVPPAVTAQVVHGLEVLDLSWGYAVALVGGNQLVWHRIDRDSDLSDDVIQAEQDFWRLVKTMTPPEVDGLPQTTDALNAAFNPDPDLEVELPAEMVQVLSDYQSLKARLKLLKDEEDRAGNYLRSWMGDATIATINGEKAVSWKPQTTNRFQTKAFKAEHPELAEQFSEPTQSRVLRTHKITLGDN